VTWRPNALELEDDLIASVSWDGITFTAIAGEILAVGDVCYLKSDGKWWLADADAETTANTMLAMALSIAAANETILFMAKGFVRYDTWNWSAIGKLLYVHTTGGSPTETRPSGSGDIVRIVGYVQDANTLYFSPDNTFVELA